MAAAPRVSVLIPVWNNADTLGRTIDSILGQTVDDLEVLALDDGSTDSSRDVVAAYDDGRVRGIPLPHRGISATLNAGLKEARAPFVAIQDADDWSLPERLERQLSVLEADPGVGVVGCRMRELDEHGRPRNSRIRFAVGDVTNALVRFNMIPARPPRSGATRRSPSVASTRGSPRPRTTTCGFASRTATGWCASPTSSPFARTA